MLFNILTLFVYTLNLFPHNPKLHFNMQAHSHFPFSDIRNYISTYIQIAFIYFFIYNEDILLIYQWSFDLIIYQYKLKNAHSVQLWLCKAHHTAKCNHQDGRFWHGWNYTSCASCLPIIFNPSLLFLILLCRIWDLEYYLLYCNKRKKMILNQKCWPGHINQNLDLQPIHFYSFVFRLGL